MLSRGGNLIFCIRQYAHAYDNVDRKIMNGALERAIFYYELVRELLTGQ